MVLLVGCHHSKYGRDTPVKNVKGWLTRNWIWLAMASIIAVLGGKLFYTYAHTFPYVSDNHGAWSSFGSLMAGFFTLTGTVATLATLLFLARQNKEMQTVTQTQMDTLTFERYISHRKLFTEHLRELEVLHKNTFTFRDPSSLYSAIFPDNSPHHCSFSVSPIYDENGDGENHIGMILSKTKTLKAYLEKAEFKDGDADEFVLHLIDLNCSICMIEPKTELRDGDVTFLERFYGFNIYTLDDFVKRYLSICNMILRFTNNPLLDVRSYQSNSRYVREALMKRFLFPTKRIAIKVYSRVKGIHILAYVFFEAQRLREGAAFLFPKTIKYLSIKFLSADNVGTLADDAVFNDMLNVLLNEVTHKVHEMDTSLEYYNDAAKVRDNLHALISRADSF